MLAELVIIKTCQFFKTQHIDQNTKYLTFRLK